ncbi:hypothetical protein I7I48_00494 [Histoplasma ohiense]|nr:hypothetical protein I7I48_00494 [Histoplasma ohiense (nom. inval.)]
MKDFSEYPHVGGSEGPYSWTAVQFRQPGRSGEGSDLLFSTRLIFPRSPQKVGAKSEQFLQAS